MSKLVQINHQCKSFAIRFREETNQGLTLHKELAKLFERHHPYQISASLLDVITNLPTRKMGYKNGGPFFLVSEFLSVFLNLSAILDRSSTVVYMKYTNVDAALNDLMEFDSAINIYKSIDEVSYWLSHGDIDVYEAHCNILYELKQVFWNTYLAEITQED